MRGEMAKCREGRGDWFRRKLNLSHWMSLSILMKPHINRKVGHTQKEHMGLTLPFTSDNVSTFIKLGVLYPKTLTCVDRATFSCEKKRLKQVAAATCEKSNVELKPETGER